VTGSHRSPKCTAWRRRADATLGVMGDRIYRLSRREDDRPVDPGASKERVGQNHLRHRMRPGGNWCRLCARLSEKVSVTVEENIGIAGRPLGALKAQDRRISSSATSNRQLGDSTRLAERIFQTGLTFCAARRDGTKFRLPRHTAASAICPTTEKPIRQTCVDRPVAQARAAEAQWDTLARQVGRKAVEEGLLHSARAAD